MPKQNAGVKRELLYPLKTLQSPHQLPSQLNRTRGSVLRDLTLCSVPFFNGLGLRSTESACDFAPVQNRSRSMQLEPEDEM